MTTSRRRYLRGHEEQIAHVERHAFGLEAEHLRHESPTTDRPTSQTVAENGLADRPANPYAAGLSRFQRP